MTNLREFIEKINRGIMPRSLAKKNPVSVRYNELLSRHTTFKVGGRADVWVRPSKEIFPSYSERLLKEAREEGIPVFILGAGANLVVSDKGIRGIVLDTGAYRGIGKREERSAFLCEAKKDNAEKNGADFDSLKANRQKDYFSVSVLAGTSVDGLTFRLAERGLSGVEFLAGMPGSVGGAVWMNARCYEKSVSDVLIETEILDENFQRQIIPFNAQDFAYKKSPFQTRQVLILSARFAVQFRESTAIHREIAAFRRDRADKGHYSHPSAGSAFKNNRDFGNPTGKIIDQLGLRGLSIGGAQIAPWHGNIVINTGNATAKDIYILMTEVARRVKEQRGLELESEILFVGDWEPT
jgi:UDP-N-acetylmuramate dehydrogenase